MIERRPNLLIVSWSAATSANTVSRVTRVSRPSHRWLRTRGRQTAGAAILHQWMAGLPGWVDAWTQLDSGDLSRSNCRSSEYCFQRDCMPASHHTGLRRPPGPWAERLAPHLTDCLRVYIGIRARSTIVIDMRIASDHAGGCRQACIQRRSGPPFLPFSSAFSDVTAQQTERQQVLARST